MHGTIGGSDSASQFKTAMVHQLRRLGETDFDRWERSVFQAVTGRAHEDVDWSVEENRQGYRLWVFSFNLLADELLREGHARVERTDGSGRLIVAPSASAFPPRFSASQFIQ